MSHAALTPLVTARARASRPPVPPTLAPTTPTPPDSCLDDLSRLSKLGNGLSLWDRCAGRRDLGLSSRGLGCGGLRGLLLFRLKLVEPLRDELNMRTVVDRGIVGIPKRATQISTQTSGYTMRQDD